MKVSFVRHGETDLNKQMRLQGRANAHLNELGVSQAEGLREKLKALGIKYDLIYSSPLIRAVETARIATGCDDIITDDRLLEIDYGIYDKQVYYDVPQEVKDYLHDPNSVEIPDTMESFQEMMKRTGDFLRDLEKKDENLNIMVVAHGILMNSFWGHIIGDGIHPRFGDPMGNCELRTAEYSNGSWKMIR